MNVVLRPNTYRDCFSMRAFVEAEVVEAYSESRKPGGLDPPEASAAIALESMPPDRKTPIGTSLSSRDSTARRNNSRNSSIHSSMPPAGGSSTILNFQYCSVRTTAGRGIKEKVGSRKDFLHAAVWGALARQERIGK